ncbi:MAG: T9SS type A sorting domain-containing protein [Bacteroidetes bacterium]|nr:T9SS type A sorting domain-containing protein [Bacteroidota bacterium]
MKKLLFLFLFINSALFAQLTIDPVNPICVNHDPIKLIANQPGGYWSGFGITDSLNGVFDPNVWKNYYGQEGTAQVKYYLGNMIATLDIKIKVLPAIEFSPSSITMCTGQSYVVHPRSFYNQGVTSYEWSGAGSGTDSAITVTKQGIYHLKISNDVCSNSADFTVVMKDTLALFTQHDSVCSGGSIQLNTKNATTIWSNGNTDSILTVTTPGTYNYTFQEKGCTMLGSFSVHTGTVQVIIGDVTVCKGDSATISAGYYPNDHTFLWSTGATTSSVRVPVGTYSVTVTSGNRCSGSASAKVKELQVANSNIINDTEACSYVYLNAPNILGSFTWTDPDGVKSYDNWTYAQKSGVYKVSVKLNGSACTIHDEANIIIHSTEWASLLNPEDSIICTGKTTEFKLKQPYSVYSWTTYTKNHTVKTETSGTSLFLKEDAVVYVSVTDNHGCQSQTYFSTHTYSCDSAFKVKGTVFEDLNKNGIKDQGEKGLAGVWMTAYTPLYIYFKTDSNGNYEFTAYRNYGISVSVDPYAYKGITLNGKYTIDINLGNNLPVELTEQNFAFINSAYKVKGTVFEDANKNGIKDQGENGLAGISMWINAPFYEMTLTDDNGNYEFTAYSIHDGKVGLNQYNTSSIITTGGNYVNIDLSSFPNELIHQDFGIYHPTRDASTFITTNGSRPGFLTYCNIQIKNEGTLTLNDLKYDLTFDDQLLSVNSLNLPYTQKNNVISFNVDKIVPNELMYVTVVFEVKSGEENLGKLLAYKGVITYANDDNLSNNISTYSRNITGSYDPNFKASSLGDGEISDSTKEMEYTIHFQNTGSDTAITIVVKDALDKSVFDIHSVEDLMGSHNYKMKVDSNGIITVTFANIMLADSTTNEQASHGFIKFKVTLKNGLTPGTNIDNSAAIYFDFNSPIITNTAHNKLEKLNSVQNINNPSLILKLYPNPTQGDVTLEINGINDLQNIQVQVIDVLGKEALTPFSVSNIGENNRINISSNALSDGMYFVKVSNGNFSESIPLVVHD